MNERSERVMIFGAAFLIVFLALAAMAGLHERHYKNRRSQMLEGRVAVIEKILSGDHD